MLHITNGESAAGIIRAAVEGEVLPWNDVLHEGPVPGGLSLWDLSDIRADYLVSKGWDEDRDIRQEFRDRDAILSECRKHDEVVLWFEHDLYDQVQLLQLLDWFSGQDLTGTCLKLICINQFPGVEPFHGLGQLDADQMATLFPSRHAVDPDELDAGRVWWSAFTSADPTGIGPLMAARNGALPYVCAAMLRHLEQFPSTANGLSRTEQQLLLALADGHETPGSIFQANAAMDVTVFMGDSIVWEYLDRLCHCRVPLVTAKGSEGFRLPRPNGRREFLAQELVLTDAGRAVLRNEADQIEINGIDRWLGGAHLETGKSVWRWNGEKLIPATNQRD